MELPLGDRWRHLAPKGKTLFTATDSAAGATASAGFTVMEAWLSLPSESMALTTAVPALPPAE